MADKYAHKVKGGSRSCRRSDGAPKRPYATEEAAEVVVLRASLDGKKLRSYHCPLCDNWHVAGVRQQEGN